MTGQGGWQPIVTYAQVGDKTRPILIYTPTRGVEYAKALFTGLDVFMVGERAVACGWSTDKKYEALGRAPTHWMPLPDGPLEAIT